MALPTMRVDLGVAGVWTNISPDVYTRDGISISRGRADEAGQVDPSKCDLTLKNTTGKYAPRNPVGPYYGVIGRNTPLRLGIGIPPAGAATGGQSGTSLIAPSVTAETAGVHLAAWGARPLGNVTTPGGYTAGTERDAGLSTWQAAYKTVTAGTVAAATATYSLAATSAAAISVFVPGASVTVTQSSASGAGVAAALSSVAVTAGDYLVAVTGWSADPNDRLHSAPLDASEHLAGWVAVADSGAGTGPRMRAWARRVRTTGTVSLTVAAPDDGIHDVYLQLWRITGATDWYPRFCGEVPAWPAQWDSSRDVRTPLNGQGILRRLDQGKSPLKSALRRTLQNTYGVVAYWPMEEPEGATEFASALGGPAMRFSGTATTAGGVTGLTLAADASLACSEPLPAFADAGAVGRVPSYDPSFVSDASSLRGWTVAAIVGFPASGVSNGMQILTVSTTPLPSGGTTMARVVLSYDSTSYWKCQIYDATGAVVSTLDFSSLTTAFNPLGASWYVRIWTHENATGCGVYLTRVDGIRDAALLSIGYGTDSPMYDPGRVTAVSVGGGSTPLAGPVRVGHVVVANNPDSLWTSLVAPYYTQVRAALVAHAGERADERFRRLCAEEHIDHYTTAATAPSLPTVAPAARMGEQRVAPLLDLLHECETTDGAVLYEPAGFLGLALRTRASKYNQAAALALSYSAGQVVAPFAPVEDEQHVRNDVTVTRPSGSSARKVLETGALSVRPPPDGVGRYDTSDEVSVWYDRDLPDQAGWRLALGTWDEGRYPSVTVNLVASPSLIAAVMGLDVGDRVTVSGLPAWLPPGGADLLTEGLAEEFGSNGEWTVTANASPGGPYRVAVLDSATLGRLDTTGSTLAAGYTSGATSMSVATATGHPLWTTTATRPSDFPLDVLIAGEQITVGAISGTSSPQTFSSLTRSVNGVVKAQSSGAQVRVATPVVLAL